MATATSASEISRLGKLAEYQVLDTPPEREFDEIVDIAAKLTGVPISLVSLIDRDRQWFKARYGLGATETPREHAFCAHAIKSDDVYVVPDATQNPLFANNPLVTGAPDIRFYAGAPLITSDRFRLGTLCIIDTKPRELSLDHERLLALLARMVVNALESRRQLMRAQHQVRMMTRLAEATVAVSQAQTLGDLGRALTEGARALVVADATCLHVVLPGSQPFVAIASRAPDKAPPSIDWGARGKALQALGSFEAAQSKDISGAPDIKGAWMGFVMGLDAERPLGDFQIWRQTTSSFVEFEVAMLTGLARVGSAAVARLRS